MPHPFDILAPHGPAVPATAVGFTPGDYSLHFFLQLATILVACRLCGWAGRRWLRQPTVVGEMVAGVALGPSLFGWLLPDLYGAIFPAPTRHLLYAGGQLGVGLYMFLVGTTLDLSHVRTKARGAAMVSAAGIAVPFVAALALAPVLLGVPGLFTPAIDRTGATLFLGACIALTAFPMLARIVTERGLAGSAVGTLSLTAGAFDDVCSWCILAVVLAGFGGGAPPAAVAIGGGAAWTALVLVAVPRLFAPLARRVERDGGLGGGALSAVLIAFLVSAFLMDAIGIHAIFGGFVMGVAMPRGRFATELRRMVEPLTVALLLPMFFTYSGLATRLGLVTAGSLLAITLAILVVSVAAKGGACYLAARLAGEDHRTALGVGALMNARGLMELIIINIGLQHGIIGPALFAMLVLMAVATTMMAGPLFDLAQRGAAAPPRVRPASE